MTDKLVTYEKTIIGVIGVHLHNNPNSDTHKIEFTTKELNCITEHMKNHIDLQAEHEALKKDVARYLELLRKEKFSFEEWNECGDLHEKLSKVGKEE